MEERQLVKPQNHRLVINNRKTGTVTGVLDVLSFDLNEILLETEQGMLMVKGTDMHVNRLNLEKGEVDLAGNIDNISYSDIHSGAKAGENLLSKQQKEAFFLAYPTCARVPGHHRTGVGPDGGSLPHGPPPV